MLSSVILRTGHSLRTGLESSLWARVANEAFALHAANSHPRAGPDFFFFFLHMLCVLPSKNVTLRTFGCFKISSAKYLLRTYYVPSSKLVPGKTGEDRNSQILSLRSSKLRRRHEAYNYNTISVTGARFDQESGSISVLILPHWWHWFPPPHNSWAVQPWESHFSTLDLTFPPLWSTGRGDL